MERILVIGCPGAGKSTLARQLRETLSLPLIHLDSLFWLPGWKQREKEEFDALLLEELKKPKWIIDGNFGRTLPLRLQYCDTVIFLDFGRFACVRGVLKRVLTHYGKTRPDMGEGCPERLDPSFLKFVWSFPGEPRQKLLSRISEAAPGVKTVILKNRRQVKKFLKNLK